MIDEFTPKIEQLIEASHSRIGADHVHLPDVVNAGFRSVSQRNFDLHCVTVGIDW